MAGALGGFWHWHGHLSEGRQWLARAVAQAPDAPLAVRATAMRATGSLAATQGDLRTAHAATREHLALRRQLGDRAGVASALSALGNDAWMAGNYAEGRALLEESLRLCRELGNTRGMAVVLNNWGEMERAQGHYTRAGELVAESLALFQACGDTVGQATALRNLGDLALAQGAEAGAQQYYADSLTRFWQAGMMVGIAASLEDLAALAGARGRPRRAARLWGAAARLREELGVPWPPHEQAQGAARRAAIQRQLDAGTWAAQWAAGRALPLEPLIAFALETPGGSERAAVEADGDV